MEALIYCYLFLIGACLGSFYNVVGLRISQGKSIVRPRSSCPNCGHELSFWELMPIINYFLLVGKCRHCKSHISTKYLIFEILTGLLFIFSYYMLGYNLETIVVLTLISLFIVISVSDLEYMLIEDVVVLFFLVLILIERYFIPLPLTFNTFGINPLLESLIGGAFGFGLLFWIAFIGKKIYNKEVMGGGDIKLYGIIGVVLGFKLTFISLFLSSIIASVIGLILIKIKIVKPNTPIPFGPFIALGSLISYFYGYELINWYFNLFYIM